MTPNAAAQPRRAAGEPSGWSRLLANPSWLDIVFKDFPVNILPVALIGRNLCGTEGVVCDSKTPFLAVKEVSPQ